MSITSPAEEILSQIFSTFENENLENSKETLITLTTQFQELNQNILISNDFQKFTRKNQSIFIGVKKKLADIVSYLPGLEDNEEVRGEVENDFQFLRNKIALFNDPKSKRKREDDKKTLGNFGRRTSLHFSQRASTTIDDIFEDNVEALLVPLIDDLTNAFIVDRPSEELETAVMRITRDIYKEDFYPSGHYNFCGINERSGECEAIVSVLKNPVNIHSEAKEYLNFGTAYKGLITYKGGTEEFSINSIALGNYNRTHRSQSIESFLNDRSKGLSYYVIKDKVVKGDIMAIGTRHSQSVSQFKIAVLYALPGQLSMPEIFANQPPEDSLYWTFIDKIGQRITLNGWTHYRGDLGTGESQDADSYYTKWKEIEIMYHIAPWHSSEQHRRLIGNDICFIIFYECPDNTPFNPEPILGLGTVPQVFSVVQPYRKLYRLAFFNRTNLKYYGPPSPPPDYLFDGSNLKEYLLTKLHNGMRMSMDCPPMNRLFTTPRAATIKEIAVNFPKGAKTRQGRIKDSAPLHKFFVTVVSGSNLIPTDKNGLSDPFVVIRIGDQKKKTNPVLRTLEPVWQTILEFDLTQEDIDSGEIELEVRDYDRGSKNGTYMGEISILVSEAMNLTETENILELHGKTVEKITGTITLQFECE